MKINEFYNNNIAKWDFRKSELYGDYYGRCSIPLKSYNYERISIIETLGYTGNPVFVEDEDGTNSINAFTKKLNVKIGYGGRVISNLNISECLIYNVVLNNNIINSINITRFN